MAGTLVIDFSAEFLSGVTGKAMENTLPYNAISNPGGWFPVSLGPNPSVYDIQQANLITTLPDGSIVVLDVLAAALPLYTVASGTINNPFCWTPQDWGYGAGVKFSDGLHKLNLEVKGKFGPNDPQYDFVSSPVVWIYNIKGVECCVASLHRRIKTEGLCCDDKDFIAAQEADGILTTLRYNITCKDWTEADRLLAQLQAICNDTNANCGGGC